MTSLVGKGAAPGVHQVMAAGVADPQETDRRQENLGREIFQLVLSTSFANNLEEKNPEPVWK